MNTAPSPSQACFHLPRALSSACVCAPLTGGSGSDGGGVELSCRGLNSTRGFDLDADEDDAYARSESNDLAAANNNNEIAGESFPLKYKQLLWQQVRAIAVRDSDVATVRMADFAGYRHLESLSVTGSNVTRIARERSRGSVGGPVAAASTDPRAAPVGDDGDLSLLHLHTLDLSSNQGRGFRKPDGVESIRRSLGYNFYPDTFSLRELLKLLNFSCFYAGSATYI